MKSTRHLIKSQDQLDGGTIADIATEAAAEAVARSQHIRQETKKLTKKFDSHSRQDDQVSLHGGALQDPDADIQDIRQRSIHQIDLSDRLPWLKGLDSDGGESHQPRIGEDCEDEERRQRDRLTSPDSGVIDHLSEATESLDGYMSLHSVSSLPQVQLLLGRQEKTGKQEDNDKDILVPPPDLDDRPPNLLQNNDVASSMELQLRDYPILPPPLDYPRLDQHTNHSSIEASKTTVPTDFVSNPAGDVYSVQEAKLNARGPTKFNVNTVGSLENSQSRQGLGQLGSKSRSNLLSSNNDYYGHLQNGTSD